jgi:type IV secretory pathway VirB4 component
MIIKKQAKDVIGVFGTRGTGKTAWIKEKIKTLSRVIILENGNEEYDDIADFVAHNKPELAAALINRGQFKILYSNFDSEDPVSAMDEMCELAEAYTKDIKNRFNVSLPVNLVIDEAQNWTSPWKTPPKLRRAIMQSRHLDFDIIYSTQRPSQISRNLTSQSNRFIIYSLAEPTDIKFFYGFIGAEAAKILKLQKYHYLDCDLKTHEIIEKML